jgi:Protein of unknown function (DUF3592)
VESRSQLAELMRRFVPPPGLERSRPREVRLTAAGKALVVTAVLLFSGAVFAGVAMQQAAQRQAAAQRLMADEGIVVDGEVLQLWRSSGDSKQPWVAYRFEADGRAYAGTSTISLSKWRALKAGATLPIRYVPAAPEQSILAGQRPGAMPLWLPSLVAIAIAAVGGLSLAAIRKERRLLMEGRPAPAVVLKHFKHHSGHGTLLTMTYEFPLLNGAIATGRSGTSRKPPPVGSVICVVYDSDWPKRSKPYPMSLVRV